MNQENHFSSGIFSQFPKTSCWCWILSQVLWQKWRLRVVVMGTSNIALQCLCQLHRDRTPRRRALPWLHQWAETVSTKCVLTINLFQHLSFIICRCPARECHSPHKCAGNFVDSTIIKGGHLEDCIKWCNDHQLCKWYTLEKLNDHCLLYEDCSVTKDCDTCATGQKDCSKGYHGMNTCILLGLLLLLLLLLLWITSWKHLEARKTWQHK